MASCHFLCVVVNHLVSKTLRRSSELDFWLFLLLSQLLPLLVCQYPYGGKETGKDIFPLKSVYPLFSETLILCFEKGVREEFSSESRKKVSGEINGQETGEFQTLLVMWNLPESSHGDYQCPQTIAGELATVGI